MADRQRWPIVVTVQHHSSVDSWLLYRGPPRKRPRSQLEWEEMSKRPHWWHCSTTYKHPTWGKASGPISYSCLTRGEERGCYWVHQTQLSDEFCSFSWVLEKVINTLRTFLALSLLLLLWTILRIRHHREVLSKRKKRDWRRVRGGYRRESIGDCAAYCTY